MTRASLYAAALTRASDFVAAHPDVRVMGISVQQPDISGPEATVLIHIQHEDLEQIAANLRPSLERSAGYIHAHVQFASGIDLVALYPEREDIASVESVSELAAMLS